MQYLERISHQPDASWYAVHGDHEGAIQRYVVTTPPSRDVCNRPEVLGVEFNLKLHDGVAAALSTAPFRTLVEKHPQERVCVVNFLRGGLNFEIRRALHTAYGMNRHTSAFMSSQRYKQEGRWHVKEDMYRKLEIPRDAVLIMGDVVATGVTMGNGLQVIIDHILAQRSSVRALVFFTIGCHKAEKILDNLHVQLQSHFPGYKATILVYLEGKFRLVDSKTPVRIGIPGTDLIRHTALLAPELELSQYASPASVLERCAIYDAGSRAFDVPTYAGDVVEYWHEVQGLALEGWTLRRAMNDRIPQESDGDPTVFRQARQAQWKGVDDGLIDQIFERRTALWAAPGTDTDAALAAVCEERIQTMSRGGGRARP